MDLSVQKQSGVQVIRLRGRLTLGDAVDSFREALEVSMENGNYRIAINFSEVPLMDSSGIGVLVRNQTTAKQLGGAIKLVQPTEFILKTLKMVGLLNLFDVYGSEDEAIAAFA